MIVLDYNVVENGYSQAMHSNMPPCSKVYTSPKTSSAPPQLS